MKNGASILRLAAGAGVALLVVLAGCRGTAQGVRSDLADNGDKLNDAIHGRPQGTSANERMYRHDPYQ